MKPSQYKKLNDSEIKSMLLDIIINGIDKGIFKHILNKEELTLYKEFYYKPSPPSGKRHPDGHYDFDIIKILEDSQKFQKQLAETVFIRLFGEEELTQLLIKIFL